MRKETRDTLRALGSEADAALLERTWSAVAKRRQERSTRAASARARTTASRLGKALLVAASFAIAIAIAFGARSMGYGVSAPRPTEAPREGLAIEGGARLDEGALLLGDRENERGVALSDGSSIVISKGTALVPTTNTASEIAFRLDEGHALFDVRPGGPRAWTIDSRSAQVRVLGTRFVVERHGDRLRVEVERGIVSVRAEGLATGARTLRAGEFVDVDDGAGPQPPVPAPTATTTVAVGELPRARVTAGQSPASPASPASAAAPNRAPSATQEDIATRLASIDRARSEGRVDDALRELRALVDDPSRDPRVSLAAFTLGKLELDRNRSPARAAAAFERCLALGVPTALEEDARARLVESWALAGESERRDAAGASYLSRYPDGHHAAAVRNWLAAP